LSSSLLAKIVGPFLSRRFVKFAAVGLSGVVVNLATLALLRALGVHTNLASAVAIEVSTLSNFVVNHRWTFGDRRADGGSLLGSGLRFHLVSLVGGAIQFVVFVAMNVAWLVLLASAADVVAYGAGAHSAFERWVVHPLMQPPRVGRLVYLSQIVGIGVAMVWNYLLNFYWTWAARRNVSDGRAS